MSYNNTYLSIISNPCQHFYYWLLWVYMSTTHTLGTFGINQSHLRKFATIFAITHPVRYFHDYWLVLGSPGHNGDATPLNSLRDSLKWKTVRKRNVPISKLAFNMVYHCSHKDLREKSIYFDKQHLKYHI